MDVEIRRGLPRKNILPSEHPQKAQIAASNEGNARQYGTASSGSRNRNPKPDELRDKVITPEFARRAFTLLVLIIPVSLFAGRTLEQTYPKIVRQFPTIAVVLALLGAAALLRARKTFVSTPNVPGPRLSTTDLSVRIRPLIGMIALGITIILRLIDLPVEYVHLGKYSALAFFGFHMSRSGPEGKRFAVGFLAAALLGTIEETSQLFVPRRVFDIKDLLLNLASALLGSLAALSLAIGPSQLKGQI